jgi:hypothetical protein
MRVRELTKRVGQVPRRGKVLDVHDGTVEVLWDDGHSSSVTGGYLFPEPKKRT